MDCGVPADPRLRNNLVGRRFLLCSIIVVRRKIMAYYGVMWCTESNIFRRVCFKNFQCENEIEDFVLINENLSANFHLHQNSLEFTDLFTVNGLLSLHLGGTGGGRSHEATSTWRSGATDTASGDGCPRCTAARCGTC